MLIGILIGTIPGILLILIGVYMEKNERSTVPSCSAKAEGTVIGYTKGRMGGEKPPVVEFAVNNKIYKTMLYCSHYSMRSTLGSGDMASIDDNAERYPVGSKVDVFYDPEKPEFNYVARYAKNYMGWTLIAGGVVTIVLVDALSIAIL